MARHAAGAPAIAATSAVWAEPLRAPSRRRAARARGDDPGRQHRHRRDRRGGPADRLGPRLPSWPRCTDRSFVAHRALGIHGAIEFGNRMLEFVLALIAVLTFVAAVRFRPARRDLRVLALVLALGVPAQALIGGITVRTDLNPWVVSLHLLTSLLMVGLAVVLVRRVKEERPAGAADGPAVRRAARPGDRRRRSGGAVPRHRRHRQRARMPVTAMRTATASTRGPSASCTRTRCSCSSG